MDMATDTLDRMKIVIYYAIWATICAALAGLVIAGLHTWLFSYIPSRSGLIFTMVSDVVTALAIAAGQGAVALGLLLGAFDFAMYFLQMAVPSTELGWTPDIIILAVATAAITLLGIRSQAGSGVTS